MVVFNLFENMKNLSFRIKIYVSFKSLISMLQKTLESVDNLNGHLKFEFPGLVKAF